MQNKFEKLKQGIKHIIPNACFYLEINSVPTRIDKTTGITDDAVYFNSNDEKVFGLLGRLYFPSVMEEMKVVQVGKELYDLFNSIQIELSNKQLEINILRSMLK